jgi:hypothetical protein
MDQYDARLMVTSIAGGSTPLVFRHAPSRPFCLASGHEHPRTRGQLTVILDPREFPGGFGVLDQLGQVLLAGTAGCPSTLRPAAVKSQLGAATLSR